MSVVLACFLPIKVGPNLGAAFAACSANELRFEVRESDTIRPAVAVRPGQPNPMAGLEVGEVNEQAPTARVSHFAQRYLLTVSDHSTSLAREADRAEAEAWSIQMEGFDGRASAALPNHRPMSQRRLRLARSRMQSM